MTLPSLAGVPPTDWIGSHPIALLVVVVLSASLGAVVMGWFWAARDDEQEERRWDARWNEQGDRWHVEVPIELAEKMWTNIESRLPPLTTTRRKH